MKNTTQNLITTATTLILTSFLAVVSTKANATFTELYSVEQEHITIKVAPKSGLSKASCSFYDQGHNKIASQNVTVSETFDNITIIEANLYHDMHVKVVKVECK